MNNTRQSTYHLSFMKTIISLIMSILLWTIVTNAWDYTKIFFGAQAGSWTNYTYDFLSRFIWSVPAIILLKHYAKDVPTTWQELFTNKPHLKPLIITVVITILYNLGAMFFNHGGFWINPRFNVLKHFPMFVMVAFAEEVVYRGWGLNALSAFLSDKKANFIATLFFIALHLPAYLIKLYLDGTFPVTIVVVQCAFACVLGLLFGYLYSKGKSLWSPMIVHFLTDFLSLILVG